MRAALALVFAVVLGACSADDGGGGDDTNTPDGGGTIDEPELRLESPDIDILPGQEVTYCWYFRTTNTKPLAIKHWQSSMSPGSHHLIMFTTMTEIMPPGMVSTVNCGVGNGFPIWTYSAQTPEAELKLPEDDGAGNPVAIEIPANQAGFIQLHYNNRSDTVIKAHVVVTGQALEEGAAFTKTAAFVTYNGDITIPPMTSGHVETKTCNVEPTSKFWLVSTHSHKRSVRTAVRDGMPNSTTMMFESSDWEHPGVSRWEAPFRTFGTGKLTYECEYNNTTNLTITDGESAQTDEMCMASGYFFPATRPVFCYNSTTF
jgi:hypothetical protein